MEPTTLSQSKEIGDVLHHLAFHSLNSVYPILHLPQNYPFPIQPVTGFDAFLQQLSDVSTQFKQKLYVHLTGPLEEIIIPLDTGFRGIYSGVRHSGFEIALYKDSSPHSYWMVLSTSTWILMGAGLFYRKGSFFDDIEGEWGELAIPVKLETSKPANFNPEKLEEISAFLETDYDS